MKSDFRGSATHGRGGDEHYHQGGNDPHRGGGGRPYRGGHYNSRSGPPPPRS